jgi:hypothetical protein
LRQDEDSGKSNQDNPGAAWMMIVELTLIWLILTVFSVVVTAALGKAAARGDSQSPAQLWARLEGPEDRFAAIALEPRRAARPRAASWQQASFPQHQHP